MLKLAADNCSWIYNSNADGSNPQLVGVQLKAPWQTAITYPVTLNGNHRLDFIVFDGGGQSGGMFRLETNSGTVVFVDTDGDGLADVTETNVHLTSPTNPDTDGDGISDGDEVANGTNPRVREVVDTDGDGTEDGSDNCPAIANANQADLDGDNIGDACDPDVDGDGTPNAGDAFPRDPAESTDTDGDGVGNNADAFDNDPTETTDTDNDGVGNNGDNCSAIANASQADLDGDDIGDACDSDVDGDGVANGSDVYPTNPAEWADSDGDGIGNNADPYDNSNTGATLMVGTCNTGVANRHLGGGTWFNDLIAAAQASAANHGKFVKAVESIADGWKTAGLITGKEHGAIVSCAARTK